MIDEVTIYIFCITLLLFSSYVGAEMRYVLGFFLILVCFVYIILNMIIIAVYSLHLLWVFLKRIYVQCRRKNLRNKVIKTVKVLNNESRLSKDLFEPKDSIAGGYKAEPADSSKLHLVLKNTELDEQK